MTSISPPPFEAELLAREGLAYAWFDRQQCLSAYSENLPAYLLIPAEVPQLGAKLTQIFPEFTGYDPQLAALLRAELPELKIERIHRTDLHGRPGYVTLKVVLYQAGLLLIIRDATGEGDLEQKVTQQRNELRLQIAARERVEEALRLINLELETRVSERTAALTAANQRLRALSRRLVALQETERRQIARELHDEIGQVLTGLKLLLGMGLRGPAENSAASLTEAQTMVNDLLNRVRQLSLDLRPAMLDDLGLLPALLWHFERYTTRTQVQVEFRHTDLDRRFASDIETAAYRIIQEALTNVARYAGVAKVRVRVWVENDQLCLEVEDQGPGFDLQAVLAAGNSSGLSGMQERAGLLDGQLEIEVCPGQGTRIFARLPLPEPGRKIS